MSRVTGFPEDEEPAANGGAAEGAAEQPPVRLPKLPLVRRIREFYHSIKLEMSKTTWPTRTEVWSTTLVVLVAVVFFGFYLWGVDRLVTVGFEYLEKAIK